MEKKENKKKVKSLSMSSEKIEMVDNYCVQHSYSFSEFIDICIDSFFRNQDLAREQLVENLEIENQETSILVPLKLYLSINKLTYVTLKNLEKQKKVTLKTLTDSRKYSHSQYVVVTVENPNFFQIKMEMMQIELENIKKRLNKLEFQM
ncbi:MAG: hypothetical protein RBS13_02685 [Bacteroidales bacterium]|jgi:hypothetical protein|nr:hypothetical protein [Bacteroidales bacterium]